MIAARATAVGQLVEVCRRWCRRPPSVLAEGATVFVNDAEMWRQLRLRMADVEAAEGELRAKVLDELRRLRHITDDAGVMERFADGLIALVRGQ
jgi:hypothetical protein